MLQVDAADVSGDVLAEVVRTLRDGGLICFPTDTAYGLGVDPGNDAAVDRLFRLKGRPSGKPILLLIDSMTMACKVGRSDPYFERIAGRFWPGPITFVVPAAPDLPSRITAGTGTIGIRWPDAALPLRILSELGGPITATSANQSGRPVARTVDDALDQLGGEIDIVMDGGALDSSVTSTVLDLTRQPPVLLREGPVSYRELAEFIDGPLVRASA